MNRRSFAKALFGVPAALGLGVAAKSAAQPAASRVVHVPEDSTLSDALTNAQDNDRIIVSSTHRETLDTWPSIDKNGVVVIGNGAEITVPADFDPKNGSGVGCLVTGFVFVVNIFRSTDFQFYNDFSWSDAPMSMV